MGLVDIFYLILHEFAVSFFIEDQLLNFHNTQ